MKHSYIEKQTLKATKEFATINNIHYDELTESMILNAMRETYVNAIRDQIPTIQEELRELCAIQHWLGTNYTTLPTDSTEMTKRARKYYKTLMKKDDI